jgi:ribonucleoside-diphosphate reductase alpha chain
MNPLYVTKRDHSIELFSEKKIRRRLEFLFISSELCYDTFIKDSITSKVHDFISTSSIDELIAEECASLSSNHPDYGNLASKLLISDHHKKTNSSFVETMRQLSLASSFMELIENHATMLDTICQYERDYLFDYFGFKTLHKSYLLKTQDNVIIERPQHLWLRVALFIHKTDFEKVKETYYYMSLKYFIHATPTLFNAGLENAQLSSCYLLAIESDSVDSIFKTMGECASISKLGGGIGIHVSNIRANGSKIASTNGHSNGIIPMLRVFNNVARYVNQGGRRNGSFAIYLEPWHADIVSFLQLKRNIGEEELKAKDLFYALWVCDLFMQRVHENKEWSLMCPNECPGLTEVYGFSFTELYEKYEQEKKYKKQMNARDLWFLILDSQMETGLPYLLYKDSCNQKSNQKNIGTIKSSNLCTEIILYSSPTETAVCNLASISLPMCVKTIEIDEKSTLVFDYEILSTITRIVVRNLNKVIDTTFYVNEKCSKSNFSHRPLGVGVQGLADVFLLLDTPFISTKSKELNSCIFETIYYHALAESCELAKKSGSYSSFHGSPTSYGILQFDLWNHNVNNERHNWTELKQNIITYGLMNSVLISLMPTASTSQILGNNECIEPITSNIFSRRTSAGEFVITNKYLVNDLMKLQLWNTDMKNTIIKNNGSIQTITEIPVFIREKYKTVWEISMKPIIDMAIDRSIFICQSQSLNLWMEDPNYTSLTSMHFYAWKKGIKTGLYYLRRKAKYQTQQFTIEPAKLQKQIEKKIPDECLLCSA